MTTQARLEEVLWAARELLRLAQEQRVALEAGALDRFDRLLQERATLFERLGADDPAQAAGLAAEFAAAAEPARAAVLTALADLARVDAENEAHIVSERRDILDALPAIDAGRRAAAAYRSITPAAYVDTAS